MINYLKGLIKPQKRYNIQSFTCFIPSPPERSTLYREKHFDRILTTIFNSGFELERIEMSECTSAKQSGIWVLLIVRPQNKIASTMDLNKFLEAQIKSNETIEGLYFLEENENDVNV